ncbi:MAG: hypothetical protein ACLP1D_02420 [Xanthobacteraceae bacterium]
MAIAAVAALSTSPALAAHHWHGHGHGVGHHHHPTAGASTSGPSTVVDVPQADPGKDRPGISGIDNTIIEDEHHSRKNDKSSVSSRGPKVSGSEGTSDTQIDTRVFVHKLHEADKGSRHHRHEHANSGSTSTSTSVAGTPYKHHAGDHHHDRWVPGWKEHHRNSVGAVADHDKKGEHRTATGVAVVPSTVTVPNTQGPVVQTGPTPPVGATGHDHGFDHGPGKPPTNTVNGNGPPAGVKTAGVSIGGSGMIPAKWRQGTIGGNPKFSGVLSGNGFAVKQP